MGFNLDALDCIIRGVFMCCKKREFETGKEKQMKIKVIIHEAEEDGYWVELPAIPGSATQEMSLDRHKVKAEGLVRD